MMNIGSNRCWIYDLFTNEPMMQVISEEFAMSCKMRKNTNKIQLYFYALLLLQFRFNE